MGTNREAREQPTLIQVGELFPHVAPRLGVYTWAADGRNLALDCVRPASYWADRGLIQAIRLAPRPGDREHLAAVGHLLSALPERARVWVMLPARELECKPSEVADFAVEVKDALGFEPWYWEYVNEPWSCNWEAFGCDMGAALDFHRLTYAEFAARGLAPRLVVSPQKLAVVPFDMLGRMPLTVDVHAHLKPVATIPGIEYAIGQVNAITTGKITSINEIEGRRFIVKAYNRSRAAGVLAISIGDKPIVELSGVEAQPWITCEAEFAETLRGRVTVERVIGCHWQSVLVYAVPETGEPAMTDYARYRSGTVWVEEMLANDDPGLYLTDWLSGEWATDAWDVELPLRPIIGERSFVSWGPCHRGLAPACAWAAGLTKLLPFPLRAVHWHSNAEMRRTPFLRMLELLHEAWAGTLRQYEPPEGTSLFAVGSDRAVLVVNLGSTRLVQFSTGTWGKSESLVPKQAAPVNGDLSMAWSLDDCGTVEVGLKPTFLVPTGLTLIRFQE